MENENTTAEPQVTASNHKQLVNASKYVVLADGRLAKLVKPVRVKNYQYYTYRNDDQKICRVNADSIFKRCV